MEAQRQKSKSYSEEVVNQLRQAFLEIDHSKRQKFCTFFTCVYDTQKVKNTINGSKYNNDPARNRHPNPIDFFVPHGEGYFNNITQSPLVRLCNHSPCIPAQHHTLAAVKVVNLDGILSQPSLEAETYLPWFPNRNHHKAGSRALKAVEHGQKSLSQVEMEEFVDNFLKATGKYPETFYRNGKRLSYAEHQAEFSIPTKLNAAIDETEKPNDDL
jgi:hypothetical protein